VTLCRAGYSLCRRCAEVPTVNSPICPTCGCSLVRLGISRPQATAHVHQGREWLFCCEGCLELFKEQPEAYLAEVEDWIVCPTCLAEKPKAMTVSLKHEGTAIHFCRCPCCLEEFQKDPGALLEKLAL
jgi:YHS domain-containing protein